MRGDPAAQVHANRAQLFSPAVAHGDGSRALLRPPVPRLSAPFRAGLLPHSPTPRTAGNAERATPMARLVGIIVFFQLPDVPTHIAPNFAELQNRIADDLSRPMIGNVSAAIGMMKFHAHLLQPLSGSRRFSRWPLRPRVRTWRVFAQQKHIGRGVDFASGHKLLLHLKRVGVTDPAKFDESARFHLFRLCGRTFADQASCWSAALNYEINLRIYGQPAHRREGIAHRFPQPWDAREP